MRDRNIEGDTEAHHEGHKDRRNYRNTGGGARTLEEEQKHRSKGRRSNRRTVGGTGTAKKGTGCSGYEN